MSECSKDLLLLFVLSLCCSICVDIFDLIYLHDFLNNLTILLSTNQRQNNVTFRHYDNPCPLTSDFKNDLRNFCKA